MRRFAKVRHDRVRSRTVERTRRHMRRAGQRVTQMAGSLRRWFLVGTFSILLIAGIALVVSPILEVRQIRVQRQESRIDIEHVQKVLAPLFGRRMLFLSSNDVLELLQGEFADLETITVSKNYPSELVVQVKLKPIVTELLIEEPPVVSSTGAIIPQPSPLREGHDYLTSNGIYVRLPGVFSGTTTLTLGDWTLRPVPGNRIVSQQFLTALSDAEKELSKALNQTVKKRVVLLRSQEFQLTMSSGITYWFDTHTTVAVQLTRLQIFRKAVGLGEVKRYVDLRISGRVVYR
jgi:cell division septal protein FtsQ